MVLAREDNTFFLGGAFQYAVGLLPPARSTDGVVRAWWWRSFH